jgi:selenide,water dikinase
MVATTTQLNRPGPELAAMATVHALTDVTGFGLVGHALELARGSGLGIRIDMAQVPMLAGVPELAAKGMVTGASGRNWAACAPDVQLGPGVSAIDQALLSDPQTSGGLLVSCSPEAVGDVLALFRNQGFAHAAEIGEVVPLAANEGARLRVV